MAKRKATYGDRGKHNMQNSCHLFNPCKEAWSSVRQRQLVNMRLLVWELTSYRQNPHQISSYLSWFSSFRFWCPACVYRINTSSKMCFATLLCISLRSTSACETSFLSCQSLMRLSFNSHARKHTWWKPRATCCLSCLQTGFIKINGLEFAVAHSNNMS